jgi:hypothetical protein
VEQLKKEGEVVEGDDQKKSKRDYKETFQFKVQRNILPKRERVNVTLDTELPVVPKKEE